METTNGRSINMALSERGINALRFVGLNNIVIDEHAEPMFGRMIHLVDGYTYSILYDIFKSKVQFYLILS